MNDKTLFRCSDGLSVRYGTESAPSLNMPSGVDIPPGFTVIEGPSGSGKSTLLKVIYGELLPTTGHVDHLDDNNNVLYTVAAPRMTKIQKAMQRTIGAILGETPDEKKLINYRRARFGYIPQKPEPLVHIPIEDTIRLTHSALGKQIDDSYLQELYARLDISTEFSKIPEKLSGGQQQRGMIAAALAGRPKIICADEPTSALDSLTAQNTFEIFRDYADQGNSLVVVSHDPRIVEMADFVLHMRDGALVNWETPQYSRQEAEPQVGLPDFPEYPSSDLSL